MRLGDFSARVLDMPYGPDYPCYLGFYITNDYNPNALVTDGEMS